MIMKARIAQLARRIHRQHDPLVEAANLLWRAHCYAVDTGKNRWQFAITLDEFHLAGVSLSELRWLIHKGFALHGQELTPAGDGNRRFLRLNRGQVVPGTCWILSDHGVKFLEQLPPRHRGQMLRVDVIHKSVGSLAVPAKGVTQLRAFPAAVPVWNPDKRVLVFRDRLVKAYRVPARNQETILNAFQEEAWAQRIDDPLPPLSETVSGRRLGDSIKQLNRHHVESVLRFHGDGTGKGVLWEALG